MFHFEEEKNGRFVLWALIGGRSRKEKGEGCIQDVEENELPTAAGKARKKTVTPMNPGPESVIGHPCTGS